MQAAAQLKVKCADPPKIASSGNLWKSMRDFDAAGQAPAASRRHGQLRRELRVGGREGLAARYKHQYNGHMPIGPTAAVAHVTKDGALVMANTQDAYTMRTRIAGLLSLPENKVRIQYWEGAGSFGNAPARHDGGQAAAVMSQLAGAPVRLQFMRWDEHGWDNYGPAIMADIRAARRRDAASIVALRVHRLRRWPRIGARPDRRSTSARAVGDAGCRRARHGQLGHAVRHREPPRDRQDRAADQQLLQDVDDAGAAGSADRLRLGAADRRAGLRAEDGSVRVPPQEHLDDRPEPLARRARGRGEARELEDDGGRARTSRRRTSSPAAASALGSYAGSQAGVVADIEVNKSTGKILVKHAYVTQVSGLGVSLEGLESQMMGSMMMGTSRTLHEGVAFDTKRVTSLDWVTYPILRFKDHPNITYTVDAAARPAVERRRRAAGRCDPGGDRERLLRRDRRAHPGDAADAGPRAQRC